MDGIHSTKPNRMSEKELEQYVKTIEVKTGIQFTRNVPSKPLDPNRTPMQCAKLGSGLHDEVELSANNPVDSSLSVTWDWQHNTAAEPKETKNYGETVPATVFNPYVCDMTFQSDAENNRIEIVVRLSFSTFLIIF